MKKLTNGLFLFFLIPVVSNSPFLACAQDTQQEIAPYISLTQKLGEEIFKTMEYLHLCKEYWEQQKTTPYTYFFGKSPSKWFWGKNQEEELHEHINFIYQEFEKNAYYLGKLHSLERQLKTNAPEQERELLLKTLKITLDQCLASISSSCQKQDCAIKRYYHHSVHQLGTHQLPSHLVRHWLQYSTIALGALISYFYWCKHYPAITEWITKTKSSGHLFIEENIKEPIQNIVDIFYKTNVEKPLISDEKMQSQEYLIKNMITEYFRNRQADKGYMARYFENRPIPVQKYTDQEIGEIAHQALKTGIVPKDILDDYAYETANPVKNLISPAGKILSIFMLKVHWVELDGYKMVQEIETIKKANLLNLQFLAIFPAIIATYLGYKTLKTINNVYNPWDKKRADIKLSLDKLEQHLNVYNRPDCSCDERTEGHLIFWIHHLKKLSPYVAMNQVTRFNELLESIEDCTQTVTQRMILVHQLIRTFS